MPSTAGKMDVVRGVECMLHDVESSRIGSHEMCAGQRGYKEKHKVRKVLFMILIKCEKLEVSNKSAR